MVKGLRRRPLTAKTRVRFSYWLLYFPTNLIHMLSIPLTWPVGQGVKTSPSHGENTSSILVLAARNFRSDSEVFLLFEYIPALVMPSLFVQKDAAKRLFSSTLRRLDSDLRSQNLNFFTENLRKQVHRRQLLHFSILQSHITIQRLSLFFLIHFLTLPHPQPVLPG